MSDNDADLLLSTSDNQEENDNNDNEQQQNVEQDSSPSPGGDEDKEENANDNRNFSEDEDYVEGEDRMFNDPVQEFAEQCYAIFGDGNAAIWSKDEAKKELDQEMYEEWKDLVYDFRKNDPNSVEAIAAEKRAKKANKEKKKKDKKKKDKKKSSKKEDSKKKKKKGSSEKSGKKKKKEKSKKKKKHDAGSDEDSEYGDDDDYEGGDEYGGSHLAAEMSKRKSSSKKSTNKKSDAAAAAKSETAVMFEVNLDGKKVKSFPQHKKEIARPKNPKPFQHKYNDLRDEAALHVLSMVEARQKDEDARKRGNAPIYRLSIKDSIIDACRKPYLYEHLVAAGVYDELVHWLADENTKELAPIDLRIAALQIVDDIPLEGIKRFGLRVAENAKNQGKKNRGEDITAESDRWEGTPREVLKETKIGWAVNFVRRHPQENPVNRNAATKLLDRFVKFFRGGDEHDEEMSGREELWATKGDPTILPPFKTMPNATTIYIDSANKPNPEDPLSYLSAKKPWTVPGIITGLDKEANIRGLKGDADLLPADD